MHVFFVCVFGLNCNLDLAATNNLIIAHGQRRLPKITVSNSDFSKCNSSIMINSALTTPTTITHLTNTSLSPSSKNLTASIINGFINHRNIKYRDHSIK